jgi:preprotein translocase subunit SecF
MAHSAIKPHNQWSITMSRSLMIFTVTLLVFFLICLWGGVPVGPAALIALIAVLFETGRRMFPFW